MRWLDDLLGAVRSIFETEQKKKEDLSSVFGHKSI